VVHPQWFTQSNTGADQADGGQLARLPGQRPGGTHRAPLGSANIVDTVVAWSQTHRGVYVDRIARPGWSAGSSTRRSGSVSTAEIVHDIDLKDGKSGREAAAGIKTLVAGIAAATDDDARRPERGVSALDDLDEYFSKKRD